MQVLGSVQELAPSPSSFLTPQLGKDSRAGGTGAGTELGGFALEADGVSIPPQPVLQLRKWM